MRFSRLLASAAVAALVMGAAGSAQAQDTPFDFSATATVTSDYVFRGISQTDSDPAIQGSLDVAHESGFFAGVWASNVDFGPGTDEDIETDFYAGYANEVGDFAYSAQAIYYVYPGSGAEGLDYVEFGLDFSYTLGFATYNLAAYWTPDYSSLNGDAWYLAYGVDVSLTDELTLYAGAGWNGFERNNNANYLNSTVGLSYDVAGFVLDAQYTATDIPNTNTGDDKFVFSISKTF